MSFRPLVAYELLSRLIAVALAVVLVLAGLWVTLLPPVIRRVTIQIENLPKAQEGFTIALLSDIHIGPTVGRSKVRKIVDATNSLRPGNCIVFFFFYSVFRLSNTESILIFSKNFDCEPHEHVRLLCALTHFLDLIAISGDLADGFVRNLGKAASPLKKLTAKYGTYFATGKECRLFKNLELITERIFLMRHHHLGVFSYFHMNK